MTVTQGGHGQGEIEWQPDNVFFSFTFEVWLSLDSGATTGPYPIFCTDNKTVCLSVEGGKITGHYGDSSVEGGSLNGDQWYNVIFRHSVAGMHNIFNYLHSFFFFYLGFMARQDYFTHFEPSQSQGRAKMGDPREKLHDHPRAEFV